MQSTADRDPVPKIPDLPSLDPGVTLLETGSSGAFQTLVVDHVLLNRETAWWLDVGANARAEPLAEIAPSRRALRRIKVSRQFTAYKHHTACDRLITPPDTSVKASVDRDDVGLVVAPLVDALYRHDDLLDGEGERMLTSSLSRLAAAARSYDCPVLVSRSRDDAFSKPVERLASETIQCLETDEGHRFVGDDFESLVYPVGNGMFQTTLAFWSNVLEARSPVYPTPITPETVREVA